MAVTIKLKIEGMRCDHCAARIKSLLEANPAVQMAEVSFDKGDAKVLYDNSSLQKEELKKIIEEAGYTVVSL